MCFLQCCFLNYTISVDSFLLSPWGLVYGLLITSAEGWKRRSKAMIDRWGPRAGKPNGECMRVLRVSLTVLSRCQSSRGFWAGGGHRQGYTGVPPDFEGWMNWGLCVPLILHYSGRLSTLLGKCFAQMVLDLAECRGRIQTQTLPSLPQSFSSSVHPAWGIQKPEWHLQNLKLHWLLQSMIWEVLGEEKRSSFS